MITSIWARTCARGSAHPSGRLSHRRLHGGRNRRGAGVRLHGALGRRRAYGDPCGSARPGGLGLLDGAAARAQPGLLLRLRKFGDLAGFSSALILGIIHSHRGGIGDAALRAGPHPLREAIFVAALGLAINLVSAAMLHEGHEPGAETDHHHDHNLRAAYVHILADAATSVLALAALISGALFGLRALDPWWDSWERSSSRAGRSADAPDRYRPSSMSKTIRAWLRTYATRWRTISMLRSPICTSGV